MASSLEFHHDTDALWQLYSRALRGAWSAPKRANPSQIPGLEAQLYGVSSDPARVKRYAQLCGFEKRLAYPMTWSHIVAFPLHLRLLTDSAFPLPLLGLVHLRNRIVQHREIHLGEHLDIRCRIANPATTSKGLEFDLCTDAFSSGQQVWEETSTTLFREKSSPASSGKTSRAPQALPRYAKTQVLAVPEATGRRYGMISGDLNPIHLHPLAARAFGFPRAIAHGMWSKARCLALLQQQPGWRDGPVEVEVGFKKPLFLPGKATLNWEADNERMRFQLLNGKATEPHLDGYVRWL
jgi:acyl dehydratase